MFEVSIDSVVRKFLERIVNKEDFLKERKKLLPLSTYYLSFVFEEFDTYNEIDLVLLCYGCKVSLVVPFYVSSIVPNHFPLKITLTEENLKLSYTAGQTETVEKLILERLLNLKISVPKKKKALEFNPVENSFYSYSGNLKVHYDIDGLSGMIPQEPLNPFLLNLNLKMDIFENPRPVRKNCFPVDFSSVKLGFVHSYLGPISVYVVFPPICEIDLSVFLFDVALLVGRRVDSDQGKLEHIINNHELEEFFVGLKQEYLYSTLYIESFGCKMGFASPDLLLVCNNLLKVLKADVVKALAIDIAVTCIPEDEVKIFPHPSLFEKLYLKPNYFLGCNKYMANYHNNEASNFVGKYGCILKINFYSLVEDSVVCLRKESFLPVHAFLDAQAGFEGVSFSVSKTKSLEKKISVIQDNFHSRSKSGYRFEITVYGSELGTASSFLSYICFYCQDKFISMDYFLFKRKFLQNVLFLSSKILNGNNFFNLGQAILAEYYLKEVFIKGSQNRHFLPSNYDLDVLGNDMFSFDVYFKNLLFSEDQALIVVNTIVQYSSLTFLKPEFVQFLKRYILILEENDIRKCVNIIYEQYVTDYIKYYNLKLENLTMNLQKLDENIIYLKEDDASISLNYFIQNYFLGDRPYNCKFPYICLVNSFKRKFDLSDSDLVNHLFTFIKLSGLNIGWKHLTKPVEEKKFFVVLDLNEFNMGMENLKELEKEVNVMAEKYSKKNTTVTRRANWNYDEHVRVLNGVMRYVESRGIYLDILDDAVYGFVFTRYGRNTIWDGFRGLSTKKMSMQLLTDAIMWNPSKLPLNSILNKVPERSKLYKSFEKLHDICVKKFKPVSYDDLLLFRSKHLIGKNLLTDSVFQNLIQKLIVVEENDFSSVMYRPIHLLDQEEYLLENCPEVFYPPIPTRDEEIIKENQEKFVKEEDFLALNEKFGQVLTELKEFKSLFLRGRQEGVFQSEIMDPKEANDDDLFKKLVKLFKKNKFTTRQAVNKLFASNVRPSAEEFELVLSGLKERGLLSSTSTGKTRIITHYKVV